MINPQSSIMICFRPSDENHPTVKADGHVDNLACAVDMILENYK